MHLTSGLLFTVSIIPSRAWLTSSLHMVPRRSTSSRQYQLMGVKAHEPDRRKVIVQVDLPRRCCQTPSTHITDRRLSIVRVGVVFEQAVCSAPLHSIFPLLTLVPSMKLVVERAAGKKYVVHVDLLVVEYWSLEQPETAFQDSKNCTDTIHMN